MQETHPRSGHVVGIGQVGVAFLGVADRAHESVVPLVEFSMQVDGPVAAGLAVAASLGAPVTLHGRLGDDHFGRFAASALRGYGVDTRAVSIEKDRVSPMRFVVVDAATHRRTLYRMDGNLTPLAAADRPPDLLDGARLLCLDGALGPLLVPAAERAREMGIPVMLEATHLGPGLGELLALSDVVISSERFAGDIAPSGEIENSLMEMIRMGPRIAVVTLGPAGALGLEGDKLVRQGALDVRVVDSSGSGPVFFGAFAYAYLRGWTIERILPFANAAAGLSCRSPGAFGSLPSLAEVQAASGVKS